MKKILVLASLLVFAQQLCAGLYDDAAQARKDAIASPSLDKYMVLNKMLEKYYEDNSWFGMTDEDKKEMKANKYPVGLFVMRKDVNKGLEVLFDEAGTLDMPAQVLLDIIYQNGYKTLAPGDSRILNFWEKLQAEGSQRASLNLGVYYIKGIGVKPDYDKAREYLEKSGLDEADYYLGLAYYFEKNTDKALEYWNKGLDAKNADSGYEIGVYYRDKKEYGKALKYFKKVLDIEPGHANTLTNLGLMYMEGLGVKKDMKKGFECYEIAADAGNPAAQYMIFKCYTSGKGCKKDLDKAAAYLSKSADQKYEPAVEMVEKLKARE